MASYYQNAGLTFQQTQSSSLIMWIHSDFVYVCFGGMRNTKTLSKSSYDLEDSNYNWL